MSVPGTLRLKLQYYADDCQFLIDGETFEYIPNNVSRDNGGGHIWEWFDEPMNRESSSIIRALSSAKVVKMKLVGSKYSNVKTIAASQLKAIQEVVRYYRAIGGQI